MEPADRSSGKKEKIEELEKELADLKQGLCIVQDYHRDLERVAEEQDAEEDIGQTLLKPLIAEDTEFEGIWKFHNEMLIHDPAGNVPCARVYESFVSYCSQKGRTAADRPSFEFILVQLGMRLEPEGKTWLGRRLRQRT